MAAVALNDLAQQIALQEAQLETLRREHKARTGQLAELTRRRQELLSQLSKVEAKIAQVHGKEAGATPASAAATGTATKTAKKKAGAKPTAKAGKQQTMVGLIVDTVRRGAGQPVPMSKLVETVERRRFPTTSSNPRKVVENRASELVKKGILSRSADGTGYVIGKPGTKKEPAAAAKSQPAPRTTPARKPTPPARAASANGTKTSPAAPAQPAKTLRSAVVDVLRKAKAPLSAREIGELVLKSGYHSTSKDFTNVIWVAIGKFDEVERAPEGGYRLKKGKGR